MPAISKIKIAIDETYDIEDKELRDALDVLLSSIFDDEAAQGE